uniref:DNA repair protein XRCC4-like n=1 Tax=Saccoglossus kowalevskii TaxID=10224 RepID=A0ABM0GYZ7_SACKO|nr:PREDICTED: DNA repair protein XRCC4-like [Saccoglossus kowalevskii]
MMDIDSERYTLSQIEVGGLGGELYMETMLLNEGNDGFRLRLTNGKDAWQVDIDLDTVEGLAKTCGMELEDYIVEIKQAFTRENLGVTKFEYHVKKYKGQSIEFSWKKVMEADKIKYQLGSVVLDAIKDPVKTTTSVYDNAIETMKELKNSISTLQTNNDRLSKERASALKRLEKCVEQKEAMENDLYGKFQVTINDKKAKIRHLTSELDKVKRLAVTSSSQRASTSHDMEVGADSDNDKHEDETDEETTDDEERERLSKVRKKPIAPQMMETDGLVLGDEGDGDSTHATKRRRIRQPSQKKQTPSKPSIPKVPSKKSSTASESSSNGRRRSIRKSKSQNVDDLFDEL